MKKFFGLHPLFFIVGILFFLMGEALIFLIYLSVVILHELAHAYIADKLGYNINKIFLLPYGAMLDIKQNFLVPTDEIKVALAGPVFNFILAFVCVGIWWLFPSLYAFTDKFVFCNLITGIINLLPCYPMDGGRILVAKLSQKLKREKALKISYIFNYIFSAIFIILFFIDLKNAINISYALMAVFVFLGTINNKFSGNYSIIKLENKNKKIYDVNQIMVQSDMPIYKVYQAFSPKKFNIVFVEQKNGQIKLLTEKTFEKYLDIYPFYTKIEDIF